MKVDQSLRERREAIVQEHVAAENRQDVEATIATFHRARQPLVQLRCREAAAAVLSALAFVAVVAPASARPARAASATGSRAVNPSAACAPYANAGVNVAECARQARMAQQLTAKYRNPVSALRDGYLPSNCFQPTDEERKAGARGAVGEHWFHLDRMLDQNIAIPLPEFLLYLPTGPSLRDRKLVAVEWYAPVAFEYLPGVRAIYYGPDPPPANRSSPAPSLFGGKHFDGPMVHAQDPETPWHYDLHVWLWEPNPDGLFAHYNPNLRCPGQAP